MITIVRNIFNESSTAGSCYINGEFFCYTLEDTARAEGVKVAGKTCIPKGLYKGRITYSPKYKREMVLIYNEEKTRRINKEGVIFDGVRMHGGNTHKDTEGCVLVAFNRINEETIQGTAEKELTKRIKGIYGLDEFIISINHLIEAK